MSLMSILRLPLVQIQTRPMSHIHMNRLLYPCFEKPLVNLCTVKARATAKLQIDWKELLTDDFDNVLHQRLYIVAG